MTLRDGCLEPCELQAWAQLPDASPTRRVHLVQVRGTDAERPGRSHKCHHQRAEPRPRARPDALIGMTRRNAASECVSGTRARGYLAHHHAVALALGPVVGEAFALVHRAGAVVEERRVLLPHPTGVVRV